MAEKSAKDLVIEGVTKAFHPELADSEPGPGRVESDVEKRGVSSTDTEPEPALGVGESLGRRGESIAEREDEEGRGTEGVKGPAERPYGTSDQEDSTGVDPKEPIDPDSPDLQRGDQGG